MNSSATITEHFDIREPIRVEMEYDVIKDGVELLPNIYFWNEFEVCVFGYHRERSQSGESVPGRSAPIPVRLRSLAICLSSGRFYVYAALQTLKPMTTQFYEQSVVAFQVIDRSGWDTSRGSWTGEMTCVVRPLLQWETKTIAN
jgi:lipopolysaccharide transport system ATP-binding protein